MGFERRMEFFGGYGEPDRYRAQLRRFEVASTVCRLIRPSETVSKADFVEFRPLPLRKKLIKLPTIAFFRNDPVAVQQNDQARASIESQSGQGNRVPDTQN